MHDQALQEKLLAGQVPQTAKGNLPLKNLKDLADSLENKGKGGLIMAMGKGGVGKTIVAAMIAVLLAQRGHKVLLTTTDPAAHINGFLDQLDGLPGNLRVERIDPKAETKKYIDKIMAQKGRQLDEAGKKLLLEDLKSPCTEEVAVFHAFSKAVREAKREFVVIDTAPTGHTLLLLDTTGSYHKEVLKNNAVGQGKINTPYMTLQDSAMTKILLVALPETTPMREAEALQNDLKRAGIVPYAWVVNQCLSALDNLTDPLLKIRAANEQPIIKTIEDTLAARLFGIPYVGGEKLLPALLSLYH